MQYGPWRGSKGKEITIARKSLTQTQFNSHFTQTLTLLPPGCCCSSAQTFASCLLFFSFKASTSRSLTRSAHSLSSLACSTPPVTATQTRRLPLSLVLAIAAASSATFSTQTLPFLPPRCRVSPPFVRHPTFELPTMDTAKNDEPQNQKSDELAESLNDLFSSVCAMVKSELQGTNNQMELLEKMNVRVAEEYKGFGDLASGLRIFVEQLKCKSGSFNEYADQINAIEKQVTEFEAMVSMLDKHVSFLESKVQSVYQTRIHRSPN